MAHFSRCGENAVWVRKGWLVNRGLNIALNAPTVQTASGGKAVSLTHGARERIRRRAATDPAAAGPVWAASDALHTAAAALGSQVLRQAADSYARAVISPGFDAAGRRQRVKRKGRTKAPGQGQAPRSREGFRGWGHRG